MAGQALALIVGQGDWLEFFNESIKTPMCIAASVCAIAGFLLSYKRPKNEPDTPGGNHAMTRPRNAGSIRRSPAAAKGGQTRRHLMGAVSRTGPRDAFLHHDRTPS